MEETFDIGWLNKPLRGWLICRKNSPWHFRVIYFHKSEAKKILKEARAQYPEHQYLLFRVNGIILEQEED